MSLRRGVGALLWLLIDDENDRQHKSGDAKEPGEATPPLPLLWVNANLLRRRRGLERLKSFAVANTLVNGRIDHRRLVQLPHGVVLP
jgi:hypothetical protein